MKRHPAGRGRAGKELDGGLVVQLAPDSMVYIRYGLTSCRTTGSTAWFVDVHLVSSIRCRNFFLAGSFCIFNSRLAVILDGTCEQVTASCCEIFKDFLGRWSLITVISDLKRSVKISRSLRRAGSEHTPNFCSR